MKMRALTVGPIAMVLGLLAGTAVTADTIMVVDADNGSWTTYDRSTSGDTTNGLTGAFVDGGLEWGGGMANAWNGSSPGFCSPGTGDTATWTVSGYAPGALVKVYVHWQDQGNAAPAAPYSVNGGATVYKDHQAGPPAADITLDDPQPVSQPFELIGEYAADGGGQVQVVLSAAAANFANADAMAFVSPADLTAPTWTATYPKADTATGDGFAVRAAINELGTVYYVVVADGTGAPSSAQVKAGQDSGGLAALKSGSITLGTADSENTAGITGLPDATAYDVYFVAEDDSGTPNLQASPVKVDISTTALDTTAPTWSATYPQVDTPTAEGFTIRAAIDEPGTAYYVVVADGTGAPSSIQVKAGQDSGGSAALASGGIALVVADTESTDGVTSLLSGTDYDVYVVAEDDESTPNLQATPVKVDITTAPAKIIMVVDGDDGSWTTYDRSSGTENTDGLTGSFADGGLDWGGGMANAWNGSSPGFCSPGTADTATWTVRGYTPGTLVKVYVHWQHQGNAAPAAPYSVNGGATVYKDHQAGPPAADLMLTDPQPVSQPFELIGEYAADGNGNVQVVLSAHTSGFANADAMAFVSPTGTTAPPSGTLFKFR